MNLHDWIDELCDALDIDAEVDESLIQDVSVAAAQHVHGPAGAVAAYLLGFAAATHDADPDRLETLAGAAVTLAEGWERPAGSPDPDDVDDDVPDDSLVDHTGDRYAEA